MKILTTVLLLVLFTNLLAQDTVTGRYREYFGGRLYLNADGTFRYTWNFDMLSSWTKGTWTLKNDTVHFIMVPTYDTLRLTKPGELPGDSLIISPDEIPERVTKVEMSGLYISVYGQNRTNHPVKLLFRKGRLYKIENGRRLTKRQKGISSGKKWVPWYFKSDE